MRPFALHKIMVALLLMVGVVLFAAGVSDSDSGYLVGVGLAAVLFAMVYGLLIIIASDINEVLGGLSAA